jgi:tetratricopeptide (TPR) repeat protein
MLDKESNRRLVIPRWNTFETTVLLGEVRPLFKVKKTTENDFKTFQKALNEWQDKGTEIYALELLGISYVLGIFDHKEVKEAAELILKKRKSLPDQSAKLASFFISDASLKEVGSDINQSLLLGDMEVTSISRIQYLKQHLREFPFDQFSWVDLALYYTILGQDKQAENAMRIALNIGYENRFVLRSSTRFFSHIGDFDQAFFWLKRTKLSEIDPWLIAAEISLSELANRFSTKAKLGRRVIDSNDFSLFDLNELASSLGTLEFNSGSVKKSKKLFRKALEKPNENTLAQTESLADELNLGFDPEEYELPAMFEAEARFLSNNSEYKKALKAAIKWFHYQPFSPEPAIYGSYIAAVCLRDHKAALEILNSAKKVSNKNFLVNNNLAFSYASLNKIEEAEKSIKEISHLELPEHNIATLLATKGLIEFRKGNLEDARDLYKSSIDKFIKLDEKGSLALAYLFLAREEFNHSKERFEEAYVKAVKIARNLSINEILNFDFKQSLPSKFISWIKDSK